MSGDLNPAHLDETCAKSDMFHRVVAHGMWGGSLISTVLGTQLPGPKTIYVDQSSHFRRPVALGDTITVTLEVQAKSADTLRVVFDYRAVNQDGGDVITGTAEVIAPTEKISRPRMVLPEVTLRRKGRRYEQLIEMTRGLNPIHTAVVHPVDTPSLLGAVEAAHAKLIVPVLVGPEHRIRPRRRRRTSIWRHMKSCLQSTVKPRRCPKRRSICLLTGLDANSVRWRPPSAGSTRWSSQPGSVSTRPRFGDWFAKMPRGLA